jgi:hypothetical protein
VAGKNYTEINTAYRSTCNGMVCYFTIEIREQSENKPDIIAVQS